MRGLRPPCSPHGNSCKKLGNKETPINEGIETTCKIIVKGV